MRLGLLFADLSAVLIGLFGLYAAVVFALTFGWNTAELAGGPMFFGGMLFFALAMTAAFLVPSVHQGLLRATFRFPGRLLLFFMMLFWMIFWLMAVTGAMQRGIAFPLSAFMASHFPAIFLGLVALFAVLIAPFGLAYTDLRAAHRERKRADVIARVAARADGSRVHHRRPNEMTWRGLVISIPLVVAVLGSMGAFRISPTTIAPAFAAELAPFFWHGVIASAAFTLLTSLLGTWWEPNYRPPAFRNIFLGIFVLPIGLAIMGFGLWFGVSKNFGPTAWNLLTDNPAGSAIYRIDEIHTTRKLRGCVTLEMPSGVKVMNCGMDRNFVASLREGERLDVTGELSPYGHTFETVRILP
ncbi:MAG: hypothetical protein AAF919_07435 [Pseudomonadota bacterium]